jgi:hypothetical protein
MYGFSAGIQFFTAYGRKVSIFKTAFFFCTCFLFPLKMSAQPLFNDTLCKYVESLQDSNLIYLKDPKDIPKRFLDQLEK